MDVTSPKYHAALGLMDGYGDGEGKKVREAGRGWDAGHWGRQVNSHESYAGNVKSQKRNS